MVRLIRAFPDFFELQIVASFLADLRNGDNSELKTACQRIVFQHLFAEAQHVEVEDMRMAAVLSPVLRKEVCQPQREIAAVYLFIVRADRVIRHDKAALHHIDEVGLRIRFKYVKQPVDFECVVENAAVFLQFVAIYLPINIVMPRKP